MTTEVVVQIQTLTTTNTITAFTTTTSTSIFTASTSTSATITGSTTTSTTITASTTAMLLNAFQLPASHCIFSRKCIFLVQSAFSDKLVVTFFMRTAL